MSSESFRAPLLEHAGVMSHVVEMLAVLFEPAVSLMANAINDRHKILTCGNGGSFACAQHLAAELTVRYKTDRNPIAALALGADNATLTACANDYGYPQVFCRQLRALGRPGDLLVAFSTSGNSISVVEAILSAKSMGMSTLALSGMKGLRGGCDVDLNVPSISTPRIQEAHTVIIHTLVEELERRLAK